LLCGIIFSANIVSAIQMLGDLEGTVTDAESGEPISGVTITAIMDAASNPPGLYESGTATTGALGKYSIEDLYGNHPIGESYTVNAEKTGYVTKEVTGVMIYSANDPPSVVTLQDFQLERIPANAVYGSTPNLDGVISPGEWDDAEVINLDEGAYVKRNCSHLHIGFIVEYAAGPGIPDTDRSVVLFDVNHDNGTSPQVDDLQLRVYYSGSIAEFQGTGSNWTMVTPSGWEAVRGNTLGEVSYEYSIPYSKIGVTSGEADVLGFALGIYHNGPGGVNDYWWPSNIPNLNQPDTWTDLIFPAKPTFESCDSLGNTKNMFNMGDVLYAKGSGFAYPSWIMMTVTKDLTWNDKMTIPELFDEDHVFGPVGSQASAAGELIPTGFIWFDLVPGEYDIVVDINENGVYDECVDVLDDFDVNGAGFFVTPAMFDFGTSDSPVASGYTRVTESTVYSVGLGYGWTNGLGSRDRGVPDSLRRDLVFSSSDRGFNIDLVDGEYTVKVIIGDNSYMHDNIDVYSEGLLKLNDVTVSAGSFVEQTFGVVVSGGQLNLVFADDGGTDVNWVVNAITIEPGAAPPPAGPMFDFGTSTSPVMIGYTRVTESTVYSPGLGYGWTTGVFGSRDRGTPDSLRRDFVFSSSDRGFNVDLADGEYTVKVIIGDDKYRHDNIDMYAEGALMLNDVTVSAGSFVERTFGVEVTDGQLNLMFADDGGTDVNWVINAIEITPGPPPFWRGYDFGTASSPLEPDYIRITHSNARDRGAPDNLRRDFIFDSSDATFVPWDIPNGDYLVTVTIGDQNYRHDLIDVYAEGFLKINDLTVEAGNFAERTFTVTLSDGELNLRFHDGGGTDANWVVNAITIESTP